MKKLKGFFKFWLIFTIVVLVFAGFIWVTVTVGENSFPLGMIVGMIGIGGFVSAAITYLDL